MYKIKLPSHCYTFLGVIHGLGKRGEDVLMQALIIQKPTHLH